MLPLLSLFRIYEGHLQQHPNLYRNVRNVQFEVVTAMTLNDAHLEI